MRHRSGSPAPTPGPPGFPGSPGDDVRQRGTVMSGPEGHAVGRAVPPGVSHSRGPSPARKGLGHNPARVDRTSTRIVPVALGEQPVACVGTLDEHHVALTGAVPNRSHAEVLVDAADRHRRPRGPAGPGRRRRPAGKRGCTGARRTLTPDASGGSTSVENGDRWRPSRGRPARRGPRRPRRTTPRSRTPDACRCRRRSRRRSP